MNMNTKSKSKKHTPLKGSHTPLPDNCEYTIALIRGMNHLNSTQGLKEAVSYLQTFIRSEPELKGCRVPNRGFGGGTQTMGWIAAMHLSGFPLREQDRSRVIEFIKSNQNIHQHDIDLEIVLEKITENHPVVIPDKSSTLAREFIGETMESVIDLGTFASLRLVERVKAAGLSKQTINTHLIPWTEKKITEFSTALLTEDKALSKAYKHLPLRRLLTTLETWKAELQTLTRQQRQAVRVKRPKTPIQQVSKLRLLKSYELTPGATLTGLNATQLIGATQAWVYNTKTKRITVYRSEGNRLGLQCSGTTLRNFDVEASECRTLRKPHEFITTVLSAGKVQLRKLLSSLTTKALEVNGRLNEHSLLLRVL